jgi:hypothetical protein
VPLRDRAPLEAPHASDAHRPTSDGRGAAEPGKAVPAVMSEWVRPLNQITVPISEAAQTETD